MLLMLFLVVYYTETYEIDPTIQKRVGKLINFGKYIVTLY